MTLLFTFLGLVAGAFIGYHYQVTSRGQAIDVHHFIESVDEFEKQFGYIPHYAVIVSEEYRFLKNEEE